ncbi:hypothetical protein PGTUg99_000343 [Puccinia graminis f. sp. tritici]|uniref:Uncharacterized protein n=1 Tax=Puccinia graminis f. sp. tritici TaxID=56615 RepID=A0A5B0RII3_PUCGR|nr:hypothetical protein PGTUg99_000343 [Puccinia graminis f. sp. tritici]
MDGPEKLELPGHQLLKFSAPTVIQRVVDFDLHAVFLMQEFRAEDTIQQIITMISTTFTEEYPPKNTLQQQLVNAAKLVNQRIQTTNSKPHMLKPILPQPLSAGAADKTIKFATYSIKKIDLQGHGDHWKIRSQAQSSQKPLRSGPWSYNARPGGTST